MYFLEIHFEILIPAEFIFCWLFQNFLEVHLGIIIPAEFIFAGCFYKFLEIYSEIIIPAEFYFSLVTWIFSGYILILIFMKMHNKFKKKEKINISFILLLSKHKMGTYRIKFL